MPQIYNLVEKIQILSILNQIFMFKKADSGELIESPPADRKKLISSPSARLDFQLSSDMQYVYVNLTQVSYR